MLVDADGLVAADVIHKRASALPAEATVGDLRAWFAASDHRKLAVLADADGRYAGSLTRSELEGLDDVGGARPAREVAHDGPTLAPDAPARAGHELALKTDALRVPVVDQDRRLVGVVGVTDDLAAFCGTS
jgi:CBS domain-containing protein